jgi:hypothetical protein
MRYFQKISKEMYKFTLVRHDCSSAIMLCRVACLLSLPLIQDVAKLSQEKSEKLKVVESGLWELQAMQDVGDKINDSVWRELGYRLVLDPLGKLVDCYQYVGETTWRHCKWPNHIKTPTSKWPGWRYGDKIVGWDMRLLAKELTILASPHQVLSM